MINQYIISVKLQYIDYQKVFVATVRGLMELGWMEKATVPSSIQKGEQTVEIWKWLTTKAKSKYIEFVKDAHYSAAWDDKVREKKAKTVIDRLNHKKDIDLMIAVGTWAGKDLANNKHKTPTMVLTASDPVSAGIIKSIEDSGYDHVSAHVDPLFYERQVRVFHDMVGFKRLGVAYENSVEGRSYAAIDMIEKVAKERDFEIVRYFTKSDIADQNLAGQSVMDAFHSLSEKKVDAMYVTVQGGVNSKTIPELVKIVNDYGIPSFSQSGSDEVKYGFLASLSMAGFKYVGMYHAETFAKVFNGTKPRDLELVFENPPIIALNLKTAEVIGFDPPVDILGAADEIFREITRPDS